ncbi:formate dehydrogenase subunit gamma [Solilutibacter silvestris]|uniref:formate dehydrogenase subunit gamma n=1 Tax=Solilutibacter silvestris TaxID=1645665 RepID=UPI001F0B86E4|nr:formate dehydrogenase subunit gamma [Lysobacter silvestris]
MTERVPQLAAPYVQAVAEALERHGEQPGALLPVLHAIQDALGFVPEGAVAPIAEALNLTRADVHGVVSFYHEFRRTPPARHSLRLCRAEACQAMGARALERHACERLGIHDDTHRSADGTIDFEPVYCLGNCALAPAGLVDGELRGRLTPKALDTVIDAMRADCRNIA